MSILCKLGIHDFRTIAKFDESFNGKFEYKACQRCPKRIVINDYLSKSGRNSKKDHIDLIC